MSFGVNTRNGVSLGIGTSPTLAKPPPWASLRLNFAEIASLDPRITFTRGTNATYTNSAGNVQLTAGVNDARFDYDPVTLACKGLLIEEARTNSIRNNTMGGAVAGTPGTLPTNWAASSSSGLAREIVGTGTTNGITWIDFRWFGTTTSTNITSIQPENTTVITAAIGQAWAASAWWAIVGGSISNITSVTQRVTGRSVTGGFIENTDTSVTLTSTLTRYAASRTMTNVLTERVTNDLAFLCSSGVPVDITLRIGLPQLEQGAFATSVIPTTAAAATRNADVASMTGTNFSSWYNQTQGTFVAKSDANALSNGAVLVAQISGGNDRHQISPYTNTTATVNGGVVQANIGVNTSPTFTTSYGYSANNFGTSTNGATPATSVSGTVPSTLNYMVIGSFDFGGNTYLNGHIARITYYPTRLPNATLQALTV